MTRELLIEICQSEEDWTQSRECLVRAFHRYPLYTHLIPNEKKRPEFLRRYLDALYDVAIRNLVLLCVKISSMNHEKATVIGAALLVPPSKNGGWEMAKDEDFRKAYEKYGLKDIDSEAMDRIEKYEEWEYQNVTKRICESGIPMWNGAFCGIDPQYAGEGCGNMCYGTFVELLQSVHQRNTANSLENKKEITNFEVIFQKVQILFKPSPKVKVSGRFLKLLHSLAMLSRRSPVIGDLTSGIKISKQVIVPKTPVVFALSHSREAVQFHLKNGFRTFTEIQYLDQTIPNNESQEVPFTLTGMLMTLGRHEYTVGPNALPCDTPKVDVI